MLPEEIVSFYSNKNNRQARIKRIKESFQKAEELMNEGCVVQWDGEDVERFDWSEGLTLHHTPDHLYIATSIYYEDDAWDDLADLTIAEINKELKDRLTVWKRVEIKL